jgi:hypothetical protein
MTSNVWQTFEEAQGDDQIVDSETDFFESIKCDRDAGSQFWENTIIQ